MPISIKPPTGTDFWVNPNVYLVQGSGSTPINFPTPSSSPTTEADVGSSYRPAVKITNTGDDFTLRCVEAVVLFPVAGINTNPLAHLTPSLSGSLRTNSDPTTVTIPAGVSEVRCPAWAPTSADAPNNTTVHMCMAVNLVLPKSGTWDEGAEFHPEPAGDPDHQGQRNMSIVGAAAFGGNRKFGFGFQAGNPRRESTGPITLALVMTDPSRALGPIEQQALGSSKFKGLPLKAAPGRPSATGLRFLAGKGGCLGFGLFGGKAPTPVTPPSGAITYSGDVLASTAATIAPGSVARLSFDVTLPAGEPVGSVHTFNVVQFDASGKIQGGIRLIAVAL